MDHLPKDIMFVAKRLSNVNRNTFRLETISSETASPGRIVTVNLPSGSLLDMKSFCWHFDVACTEVANAANADHTVRGRLPADVSSLISRVECYLNGIQVQQGTPEYGTICRILKIGKCSRDKDGSVDRALSHGAVISANEAEDISCVVSEWTGFLGQTSTRYLPMDLLGDLQVRISLAPASVLLPKQHSVDIGANMHAVARTAAAGLTYSISNMYFTIDSVSIDPMYNEMLRERLTVEEFIPLNYKEYYAFTLDNITGPSHSTRFSLSATSIDRMYGTFRNGNYQISGVKGHSMTGSALTELLCSSALRFQSFNSTLTKKGDFKCNWTVNNVRMPQHQAGVLEGLFALAHTHDKVHTESSGNLITSLEQYQDGMFVVPLTLCHPGEGLHVQSGYNSKGINTMMSFDVSGQVVPTGTAAALVASQTQTNFSSYVLVETTAQLRIGLGKNLSVVF